MATSSATKGKDNMQGQGEQPLLFADALSDALGLTDKAAKDAKADALTFREFVCSPDYLGKSSIYEYWLREMGALGEVNELILDGSLGTGKSLLGAVYMVYRICKLFMRGRTPQEQFGLDPDTDIYIMYFSVSLVQAKRSGFNYLFSLVDECKWFRDNCPRDANLSSEVAFANKVHIIYASGEQHQIGLNVWGFILDEANFRSGVGTGSEEQYAGVYALCEQLLDRQYSRFLRAGKLDSLAIFISSASYETSFIEHRKALARGEESAAVITSVKYKVTPERYSAEMFEVFCGYGNVEPCIVQDDAHKRGLLAACGHNYETGAYLFEQVPVTLYRQFQGSIYLALQNHCGRATGLKGTFITNMQVLLGAYTNTAPSPFNVDDVVISNRDSNALADFYNVEAETPEQRRRPHSLFLDLATNVDFGSLSCVRYDGQAQDGKRMHTHVWTIGFRPPEYPASTMISKVKDFIVWLSGRVNVAALGSDQYQSMQLRQDIAAMLGLPDTRISVDSSDKPHLHWLNALIDKRFAMRRYERLDREIKEAQHDTKRQRVVKRKNSTDDQFQSVVAAFFISDTIVAASSSGISLSDVYNGGKLNIVGGNSVEAMLRKLGYR